MKKFKIKEPSFAILEEKYGKNIKIPPRFKITTKEYDELRRNNLQQRLTYDTSYGR